MLGRQLGCSFTAPPRACSNGAANLNLGHDFPGHSEAGRLTLCSGLKQVITGQALQRVLRAKVIRVLAAVWHYLAPWRCVH